MRTAILLLATLILAAYSTEICAQPLERGDATFGASFKTPDLRVEDPIVDSLCPPPSHRVSPLRIVPSDLPAEDGEVCVDFVVTCSMRGRDGKQHRFPSSQRICIPVSQ